MFSLRRKKDDHQISDFSENLSEDDARIVIDEQGNIVFASAAFMNIAEIDRNTIGQHNFTSLLKFRHDVREPIELTSGTHTISLSQNGTEHNFYFDWITLPGNNGARRFLVGSHSENALEQPTPIFEATPPKTKSKTTQIDTNTRADRDMLLKLSREIMVVTDTYGKILRANPRFVDISGYSANDLDNLNFIEMFEEDDKRIIIKENQCEARILTQSGETRWVDWDKHPHKNAIYYVGRDITAIKTQQKALEHREDQLSQAESLGRMGHWRWVLDEDSIQWSDEIYRIFGVERDTFEATLDTMSKMVHPEDIDRVNQALQRAIIEENDYDVEFSIQRPDGEERFIRSEGRCFRDDDGEVIALFGIMQDITERMLYERELRSAKDSAERAYAAKTQFLANMSHELRTPLNAIIGFSEMMEQQLLGPLGNQKYVDYIGGIRESGEHLLDLISDILDMSKIEAGKYELALEELNIHKIIQLAAHMMEGRAQDANIKLNFDTSEEAEIKVVADRRALLQIILNLLSNAVKFSKENAKIDIECESDNEQAIIKIIDNGIGIPANKLATITNPFEQVSSSYARDHEGSGLGLAITKELTELHGGNMELESTIDIGTTVTINLPLKPSCEEKTG